MQHIEGSTLIRSVSLWVIQCICLKIGVTQHCVMACIYYLVQLHAVKHNVKFHGPLVGVIFHSMIDDTSTL